MHLLALVMNASHPGTARLRHWRRRRQEPVARRPLTETGFDLADQAARIEIADHGKDCILRPEVTAVMGQDIAPCEAVALADDASRITGEGMGSVDQTAEGELGPEGRVFQVAA
jgi:hypothetical protein